MNPANFLRETIDIMKQIETRFIELGMRLSKIRSQEMWKSGGYANFSEYLDAAKISKGNASMLISVYEHYLLPGVLTADQLVGAPYSSLYEAIPLLKDSDPETVVAKVKLLTRSEIKDEVREEEHEECPHTETIHVCKSCRAIV